MINNSLFVLNPLAVLLAFGFAAVVGVGFGFYPAQRAARMDPIVALRTEYTALEVSRGTISLVSHFET